MLVPVLVDVDVVALTVVCVAELADLVTVAVVLAGVGVGVSSGVHAYCAKKP
jgi:hypothetical protein